MDIANLKVGDSVLLKLQRSSYLADVEEFKVLEYSPSGIWIKLQNINGNKFWRSIAEILFVEALKPIALPDIDGFKK